jgi:hypothetical protein
LLLPILAHLICLMYVCMSVFPIPTCFLPMVPACVLVPYVCLTLLCVCVCVRSILIVLSLLLALPLWCCLLITFILCNASGCVGSHTFSAVACYVSSMGLYVLSSLIWLYGCGFCCLFIFWWPHLS